MIFLLITLVVLFLTNIAKVNRDTLSTKVIKHDLLLPLDDTIVSPSQWPRVMRSLTLLSRSLIDLPLNLPRFSWDLRFLPFLLKFLLVTLSNNWMGYTLLDTNYVDKWTNVYQKIVLKRVAIPIICVFFLFTALFCAINEK
ncbi:hypothetical protein SHM_16940 [Spiroplasma ixodetis]|uniref:Uncharacterized protein n=1 Tax=Spiroplasma ixodetis TaxID=2141 RepID=A0ABN6SY40_9MOLU|nr:hypothetical protein SHM_16940 [Spiroplasma ixodetis]